MGNIIVYRRVFDRKNPTKTDFDTFLNRPEELMGGFAEGSLNWVIGVIKRTKDKEYRNYLKRNNLPVVELYPDGILSIDIDELYGDQKEIGRIVNILKEDEYCLACKGTPSKNLVAFYRFECSDEEFPYLFYKLYLELTLKLNKHIDFLPEKERLRYISNGEVYFHNPDSKVFTEILEVDELPYILKKDNAVFIEDEVEVKEGRKKVKRSRRRFIYNS